MDGNRFDDFTRALGAGRSRRSALKLLGGAVASGAALRRGGAHAADKTTICHKPGTPAQKSMDVASAAVGGHLGHGDYVNASGCCPSGVPVCVDAAGNGSCCPAPSRCLADGTCCTPMTCAAEGKNCGFIPDLCGEQLDCGTCDSNACLTCTDNTCETTCTAPASCCGNGTCGLQNGPQGCTADEQCCSGTCVAGTCQAQPGAVGAACDSDADCTGGTTCVDGVCCSTPVVCGGSCCTDPLARCHNSVCCVPATCASLGAACGTPSDGCGGTLSCGTCAAPNTCGGGGTPGQCGCTSNTCESLDAQCGDYPNNCGGEDIHCGTCPGGFACNAGGCVEICDAVGTVCNPATEQCCTGESCDRVYEPAVGIISRCCRQPQEPCNGPGQCCNPLIPGSAIPDFRITAICQNNEVCCVPPAFFCRNDGDCCAGSSCRRHPRQYCHADADLTCCLPVGSACSAGSGDCECCSGYCDNGQCANRTCLPALSPCPADERDCCSGLCFGDSIRRCAPFGLGCIPIGGSCDFNGSSCCSGRCDPVSNTCLPYT